MTESYTPENFMKRMWEWITNNGANAPSANPPTVNTGATVPDVTTNGTISGNTAITLALSGQATATIQDINTGFTGTLTFKVSDDGGTTYNAVAVWPVGQTATGNLITSNATTTETVTHLWETNVAGMSHLQVVCSGFGAGTAAITLRAGLSGTAVVLDGPLPTGSNVIGALVANQSVKQAQDATTIAGSAPGTAGNPSTNVVSVQGVASGTGLPTTQAAPLAANILDGFLNHVATTAATTLITVPQGRTWIGYVSIQTAATNNASVTGIGNARGTVATAGSGVTPAAGTVLQAEALAGANAATGTVGTSGIASVTSRVVVIAPAGNSVTLTLASNINATQGTVNVSAVGELQ
ncbi:MAG: hypothetical protein ACYDCC_04800 [Actinomycetota bacterium]